MSQELTYGVSATENKNGVTFQKTFNGQVDVSGNSPLSYIQNIGTSDETLDLGDISTIGFVCLRNMDVTNYVEIGHTSGTYALKLKAGEFCLFRAGAAMTAIHAKANTAAINLEVQLLPD
jgi:hypothetical protein